MGKCGVSCCMPGCTNYFDKTKDVGISYLSFPKKGVSFEQDEWRRQLIICVTRADSIQLPRRYAFMGMVMELLLLWYLHDLGSLTIDGANLCQSVLW